MEAQEDFCYTLRHLTISERLLHDVHGEHDSPQPDSIFYRLVDRHMALRLVDPCVSSPSIPRTPRRVLWPHASASAALVMSYGQSRRLGARPMGAMAPAWEASIRLVDEVNKLRYSSWQDSVKCSRIPHHAEALQDKIVDNRGVV